MGDFFLPCKTFIIYGQLIVFIRFHTRACNTTANDLSITKLNRLYILMIVAEHPHVLFHNFFSAIYSLQHFFFALPHITEKKA